MSEFSVKISWQTPQLIRMMSASSWIIQQQPSWMSSSIFSTLFVVLFMLHRPEHSSSSADTQMAMKLECHSKTIVQLKECSAKAS
jgi:hypothetical protein